MKSTKKNQKSNMPKNAIGDTEILNLTIAPEMRDEPPRNGLCADMGPQIFFPFTLDEQSGPEFRKKYIEARSNTQTAKEMCHQCHVINECFAYSVYHEKYGIWAGLTERQRQTIRRRLKIKLIQREPINMIPGMNLR
jgi:hypothetical protein